MMRFEQTVDVLEHVGLFHRKTAELYRALTERVSSPRVKMLLDYMARHEDRVALSIREYRDESRPQVLSSWFKYTHDEDIFAPLKEVDLDRDYDFDDVLDLALTLDSKLLELYQDMSTQAVSPEVKDMFNSLLLREMEEKQKLMRAAAGLLDL
ncbi:hypothetical protein [Geoalkalibacter subterraneus]|uniref:Rubrerythrin diiron-binding domain-containing protein n=1 Tax=Geoalkalibacter subterraneus TaxID=483547 RepID=A0A0B5FTD3_9BACT|nr:hypothetical protein [Geoalkalibacter subterraneus]AJF07430.1 hypothetical protein GSUB_13855 [Geoalkalibacter subterraneus]